jgi:hypothetical protein
MEFNDVEPEDGDLNPDRTPVKAEVIPDETGGLATSEMEVLHDQQRPTSRRVRGSG